ncbi:hypothetical protein LJB78_01430, partial [Bacteroidales bacterium OttesenSCG-928-J16]|nr:hypothetical protein [Bacteroidales bacterium OttesenSCG-928-J16]
ANTALVELNFGNNQLTELDVSANTLLEILSIANNQLTEIDLSANVNLQHFYSVSNRLSALDVSANPKLNTLSCPSNQLTELDVSAIPSLSTLQCGGNRLTALDLSANTKLRTLQCHENRLAGLDLSGITSLNILYCNDNALPLADLKAASDKISSQSNKRLGVQVHDTLAWTRALAVIDPVFEGVGSTFAVRVAGAEAVAGTDYEISGGEITFKHSALYEIEISNPAIVSASGYDAKVIAAYDVAFSAPEQIVFTWSSMWSNKSFTLRADAGTDNVHIDWGNGVVTHHSGAGPDSNISGTSMTYDENKEYTVTITTDPGYGITYLHMNGSKVFSFFDVSGAPSLTFLNCFLCQMTELDVSANTALTRLDCSANLLTDLDLSANTALTYLQCDRNLLTSLDVSANTALTYLNCGSNQLTELDVSANTALETLYFTSNQLTAIDLSANPEITALSFRDNLFTEFDWSAHTALIELSCAENPLADGVDLSGYTQLSKLYCYESGLTELDLSDSPALTVVWCYDNSLSLGTLKTISDRIILASNKYLGPQIHPAKSQSVHTALIDPEFHGEGTDFEVKVDGQLATGDDYSINGGVITFKRSGLFEITMSRQDITSYSSYPAKVILTYDVSLLSQQILFTWPGSTTSKSFNMCVDAGTNNVHVDWGNGTITHHNGAGANTYISGLSITYGDTDNHDVIITTELGHEITYLGIGDLTNPKQLSSVDVSGAPSLTYLDVSANILSALDVSGLTALRELFCGDNQLTALDVSVNTALTSLSCSYNQLIALDVSANTALTILSCNSNQLTTLDL